MFWLFATEVEPHHVERASNSPELLPGREATDEARTQIYDLASPDTAHGVHRIHLLRSQTEATLTVIGGLLLVVDPQSYVRPTETWLEALAHALAARQTDTLDGSIEPSGRATVEG
jgi:hypothetical protein